MINIAVRWSGLLLIAGAALLGIAILRISLHPVVNQLFTSGISLVFLISSILLLLSFPGMYLRQANSAGWLGLAGFVLLQIGILILAVMASTPLLYPEIKTPSGENIVVFLLGIALVIGLLLTGIATIQAKVFPLGSGILILTATAGFFFVFFIAEFLPPISGQIGSAFFGVVLALALIRIGVSIWNILRVIPE
ncbi:MAG TPA: hypothetical protein PK530_04540 [Anaerolineales bacterium]|nr:hypothetical protein [Anaerolineales bacterium]